NLGEIISGLELLIGRFWEAVDMPAPANDLRTVSIKPVIDEFRNGRLRQSQNLRDTPGAPKVVRNRFVVLRPILQLDRAVHKSNQCKDRPTYVPTCDFKKNLRYLHTTHSQPPGSFGAL